MKKILLSALLLCGVWGFLNAQEAKWLLYPSISPDGTQIAFCYMGDIYLTPVTGGEARRLTSHPAYDTRPVWSPDGQKIAFASDRDGGMNIYVTDV